MMQASSALSKSSSGRIKSDQSWMSDVRQSKSRINSENL